MKAEEAVCNLPCMKVKHALQLACSFALLAWIQEDAASAAFL
jgi:hypothetical protein